MQRCCPWLTYFATIKCLFVFQAIYLCLNILADDTQYILQQKLVEMLCQIRSNLHLEILMFLEQKQIYLKLTRYWQIVIVLYRSSHYAIMTNQYGSIGISVKD